MNCPNSFFGCAGFDPWDLLKFAYGFLLALGAHYLGDWLVPIALAIAVLCLLGLLGGIFKWVRSSRGN